MEKEKTVEETVEKQGIIIPIRINFEDAEAERFEVVKRYLGLKQNTEVLRALISEKFNEIRVLKEKLQTRLETDAIV
jgi:hypothetical protein